MVVKDPVVPMLQDEALRTVLARLARTMRMKTLRGIFSTVV